MRHIAYLWSASVILLFALIWHPALAQAQTSSPPPPERDPQALAWAGKALATLSGSTAITDVTLEGNATRTAGSDTESGNITLKALGNGSSRFDLSLAGGMFSEIRNNSTGVPQGWWITPDGVTRAMVAQNTFTDAAWFFPALSVLSELSNPQLSVTYVGQEIRNGASVEHLRFSLQDQASDASASDLLTKLSTTDLYLDAASALPVAIAFDVHPDNDALSNIPVEIDFSNYQAVNGIVVPLHIQKLLNGTLFLDVTIQTVKVNSGLTISDFSS